jgi:hypothetical protein
MIYISKACIKQVFFFVITVIISIKLQYNVTDIFILKTPRFNGLSIKRTPLSPYSSVKSRVYCILNFSVLLSGTFNILMYKHKVNVVSVLN